MLNKASIVPRSHSLATTQAAGEVDAFYEPTDNQVATNMELVRSVTVPAGKPAGSYTHLWVPRVVVTVKSMEMPSSVSKPQLPNV